MGQHDVWGALQGFVVAAFEPVALFGRAQHVASFHQQILRGFDRRGLLIFKDDIAADDEM